MATITITTTAPMDARIQVAFGQYLHPGRDATGPEIKAWLIEQLRSITRSYEYQQSVAAVPQPPALDPT